MSGSSIAAPGKLIGLHLFNPVPAIVGLDVRLNIAEHLERELGPRFTPPPVLREKVAAGKLGRKTGQGFYTW